MKRLTTLWIAAAFVLGTLASAQQEPAQPPPTPQEANDGHAMVRFVHASPNASVSHVMMTSDREGAGGIAIEGFGDVSYADMSDYVELPAGTYDVTVVLEAVEGEDLARIVSVETFAARGGGHYTVTLMGLVFPHDPATEDGERAEEAETEEAEADVEGAEVAEPTDEAFMAWLQGLDASDVSRQDLALRLVIMDDEATATVDEGEMWVRVVHAAPGTEPVALAVIRTDADDAEATDAEDAEILQTVSFGEASAYASVRSEDVLEVRTEDGEAVILDMSGENLEAGMLHTIFVAGTPVAVVPIESFVASTEPADVEEAEEAEEAAEETDREPVTEAAAEEPARTEGATEEPTDRAAQVTTPEGAEAATDEDAEEPAEAEAAVPTVAPTTEVDADDAGQAMVRFVHAAPNASIESVLFVAEGEEADGGLTITEFGDTGYAEMTEYFAIPAGSYEILVMLEPGAEGEGVETRADDAEAADSDFARIVSADTLNVSAGGFYTITLMGLMVPQEIGEPAERAEGTDEAFEAWIAGLFAEGADREEYALRVMVLDDEATTTVDEETILVRVVHAAPGTEPVSLAVQRADDENGNDEENGFDVVQTVSYGDASGYLSIQTGDVLQVRTEDGQAVILDLADENLEPGMLHTVFVTGTPVEAAPIEAMVATTEPADMEAPAN